MAKITTKYKCGDNVIIDHARQTKGKVTAIFIRGRGRSYEISYTDDNGPTNCVCGECELRAVKKERKFGY